MQYNPKISIIVPTYNTPRLLLKKCIESVINQEYQNWELCIADDASPDKEVREVINEFSKKDSRIKAVFLKENRRISGASNEAIKLATGDFIGFLDHDDELLPMTLSEVVNCIEKNKDVDLIYTDEAKILEDGTLVSPTYKPDLSPEYLMSNNYICHFSVYRTSLLNEIGLLRDECNGSQDYDLVLRVVEKAKKIIHIPKVLYLWRMIESSVASNPEAKIYAFTAAQIALKDSLLRNNKVGSVQMPMLGWYHVRYQIKDTPLVTVIIIDENQLWNQGDLINQILTSYTRIEILYVTTKINYQKSSSYLKQFINEQNLRILIYESELNVNSSVLKNYGAKNASGEYLLFLNSFIVKFPGNSIVELLSHAQLSHVGLVGAECIVENEFLQYGGLVISDFITGDFSGTYGNISAFSEIDTNHQLVHLPKVVRNSSSVTGCILVEKEKFFTVDGFDESLGVFFDEVDLGFKFYNDGYYNVWNPFAQVILEKTVIDKFNDIRVSEEFTKKWHKLIYNGDPFYRVDNMKKITLKDNLSSHQRVVIFGATIDGEKCKQYVNKYGVDVSYFIDNAKSKQNQFLGDVMVLSPENFVVEKKDDIDAVILVSAGHKKSMKDQLLALGFNKKILEY